MKIIMYHYVRPYDAEFPFFNNIDPVQFGLQLDFFAETEGLLSRDRFADAILSGENSPGFVLSFDDGLSDHYKYVLPELDKRGLWGLFYVPTGGVFSVEKKLLAVHRVHYLKGKYGASEILSATKKIIEDSFIDENSIQFFDKNIYQFQKSDTDELYLKKLFNYHISYEHRDFVLDALMEEYFDENHLWKQVYLSSQEIKEISNSGSIIGAHTLSHPVLSRLDKSQQYSEINGSFDILESVTGVRERYFSYPYGYRASYNNDTLQILRELGVKNAVIFDNKAVDDNFEKLELSRLDCNLFMN